MIPTAHFFEGTALLIGTIVGAGILGIPFVVAKVGLTIGLAYIVGIGILFLLLNLMMGEMGLPERGRARLIRERVGVSGTTASNWLQVCADAVLRWTRQASSSWIATPQPSGCSRDSAHRLRGASRSSVRVSTG